MKNKSRKFFDLHQSSGEVDFFLSDSIKDNKLESYYKKKIIDNVGYKKIDQEEFLNLSVPVKKLNILFIIAAAIMAIIVLRIFFLQIYKGDYYRERAEGNRIRIETIMASRGLVYDRNNNLLVENKPSFVLTILPGDLPDEIVEKEKIFNKINEIIGISSEEIKNELLDTSIWQYKEIASNLTYEQAIQIMVLAPELPGVQCRAQAVREYKDPIYLSHVLGYLGKINEQELEEYADEDYLNNEYIGKSGLESYYEKELRGVHGKKQIEVDSKGNEIQTIAQDNPVSGNNLILSLDMDLQKVAYDALNQYCVEKDSPGGVVVAMDPRNGEILAFVSWPGFDTNEFINGIKYEDYQKLLEDKTKPLFNKVISGEYPSGSTFKPVVAAAALQEGVISESTTVESSGGIQINAWFFPDWKAGGHGITNVTKALAESVNTFFYIAGGGTFNADTNEIEGGLGLNRINKYAEYFGLGKPTGIDLSGEKSGFLPTKEWKKQNKGEDWYIGDTYHVAIGQGDILVTPLQVANFTAAIANNGTLYKPHLIKEKTNYSANIYETILPTVMNENFISQNNLEIVKIGMKEAVEYGSAKGLQNLPVTVAAKTGTAEHSGSDKNHSWITSFAPYASPEIVVTALVEEGGEGTESALPVVYQVLNAYFN